LAPHEGSAGGSGRKRSSAASRPEFAPCASELAAAKNKKHQPAQVDASWSDHAPTATGDAGEKWFAPPKANKESIGRLKRCVG
jgi:hypothetical protein